MARSSGSNNNEPTNKERKNHKLKIHTNMKFKNPKQLATKVKGRKKKEVGGDGNVGMVTPDKGDKVDGVQGLCMVGDVMLTGEVTKVNKEVEQVKFESEDSTPKPIITYVSRKYALKSKRWLDFSSEIKDNAEKAGIAFSRAKRILKPNRPLEFDWSANTQRRSSKPRKRLDVGEVVREVACDYLSFDVPKRRRRESKIGGTLRKSGQQYFKELNQCSSREIFFDDIFQRLSNVPKKRRTRKVRAVRRTLCNAIVECLTTDILKVPEVPLKRPLVLLNEISKKMWELTIGIEGSEMDGNTKLALRGEQEAFDSQVNDFLSIASSIQGCKKYSEWKGSIMDSIVGVFLTQNANDVSTSNAFMHLAKRFPRNCVMNGEDSCCCKEIEKVSIKKDEENYWESLRQKVLSCSNCNRHRTPEPLDSIDYEALRDGDENETASIIKSRGMHVELAKRIKVCLNRIFKEHGSLDMEWLRFIDEDKVKEYLLRFHGLGLKSVECIRLLDLQHSAFPVDTNVARISVRLGWVPLQPLPLDVPFHTLKDYPKEDHMQQYLWPRLCQRKPQELYELHYHLITFGKAFCSKGSPNCKECPLRTGCKYYASKFPSCISPSQPHTNMQGTHSTTYSSLPTANVGHPDTDDDCNDDDDDDVDDYIDEDASGGDSADHDYFVDDIEDLCNNDDDDDSGCGCGDNNDYFVDDIEDLCKTYDQTLARISTDIRDITLSNPQVPLTGDGASKPRPEILRKKVAKHLVYALPDDHPLLVFYKIEARVVGEKYPYLLIVWGSGEIGDSSQTSMISCDNLRKNSKGFLCSKISCSVCNKIRKGENTIVQGTLLIPARTAVKGSFPLNGTYFQTNEVFADNETSLKPLEIHTSLLQDLPELKLLHCGSSLTPTLRGYSLEQIQEAFHDGFFCFRMFDRKTGLPRALSQIFFREKTVESTRKRKSSY